MLKEGKKGDNVLKYRGGIFMYDMNKIIKIRNKCKHKIEKHFEDFFVGFIDNLRITVKDKKVKCIKVTNFEDFLDINANEGFYIILSNYNLSKNKCKCAIKIEESNMKVKAIYRGECSKRRERLIGHLYNKRYEGKDKNFMKIDNNNGINIDEKPYVDYEWYIITCSMSKSTQMERICAEKAFDSVYGKPMYSDR